MKIINKNLKFTFDDLTQYVDITKSFTLKDVFNCIKNSKVPIGKLKKILKCSYLEEYIDEIFFKTDAALDYFVKECGEEKYSEIKYLEVYCGGDMVGEEDKVLHWNFHGIGKADKIGCTKYGLDFTPLYKIADLEVRISNIIESYDLKNKKIIKTKFTPLIMLVELLHAIVWEISWNGSIKNRDARMKELKRRVDCIEDKRYQETK